jgi:hypothetical protein
MKLYALALALLATLASANPVPVAEEVAPIDLEKRTYPGVGVGAGYGAGYGTGYGTGFGYGFGFPATFVTDQFRNTNAANQVAFNEYDNLHRNVNADHDTQFFANSDNQLAAANTAAVIAKRNLDLQRRYFGAGFFPVPFVSTNANFLNAANTDTVYFNDQDHLNDNIDATHAANYFANSAVQDAANNFAAAVGKRNMELQRRGYPIYDGIPNSFFPNSLGLSYGSPNAVQSARIPLSGLSGLGVPGGLSSPSAGLGFGGITGASPSTGSTGATA